MRYLMKDKMKKLLTYIFLAMFSCSVVQAVELNKINRYIFGNLYNDAVDCFVFYGITKKDFTNRDPNDPIIKELEIGQNRAYDLFMAFIKPLGISREEAGVKVKALIKQNANTSSKTLINQYGQFCKDLMNNQDDRMRYWKKKYLEQ